MPRRCAGFWMRRHQLQATDKAAFVRALAGVYALYRVELSEAVISIWWQAMRDYDLPAIIDAFGRHSMNPDTGQFLPRPADVVKMLHGSTLDSAQVAWTKLQRAVQQIGTYASVCFDDPIINAVVSDMGGWVQHGQVSERELPFKQKEFESRYRGYKARGGIEEYPRFLRGIADQVNAASGYAEGDPVLVGEPQKAALVYRGGGDSAALELTPLSRALKALPA